MTTPESWLDAKRETQAPDGTRDIETQRVGRGVCQGHQRMEGPPQATQTGKQPLLLAFFCPKINAAW